MNAWILIIVFILFILMLCLVWWSWTYYGPGIYSPYIDAPVRDYQYQFRDMNRSAQADYEKQEAEKLVQIRLTQKRQMKEASDPEIGDAVVQLSPPQLIIGVDARPRGIGGYCIDLVAKSCAYYAMTEKQLPWDLHDTSEKGDPAEFKMKNIVFALLLWENQISQKNNVEVYTDNSGVLEGANNEYGERSRNLIDHFKNCNKVKFTYKVVNSIDNVEKFSKFIQPADDLSRGRVDEALKYLKNIYDLQDFKGSCISESSWEDPHNFVRTVKEAVKCWQEFPCSIQQCSYNIGSTASLRSILIQS